MNQYFAICKYYDKTGTEIKNTLSKACETVATSYKLRMVLSHEKFSSVRCTFN